MKYVLQQPNTWSRWAIVDERGTEICDGPHEQKKTGLLVVSLLNGLSMEPKLEGAMRLLRQVRDMFEQRGGYTEEAFKQALEDQREDIGEPWLTAQAVRAWLRENG
jgi:hypothetical protein